MEKIFADIVLVVGYVAIACCVYYTLKYTCRPK